MHGKRADRLSAGVGKQGMGQALLRDRSVPINPFSDWKKTLSPAAT